MEVTSKAIRDARRNAKRAQTSTSVSKKPSKQVFSLYNVERPLQFQGFHISFDRQSPMRNFLIKRGLACPQFLHWVSWNGYHVETIANLFNTLPAILFSSVEDAVNAVNLVNSTSAPPTVRTSLSLQTEIFDVYCPNQIEEMLANENELQRLMDPEIGYQVITLDPHRGVRRDHRINSRLASMYGMHREEMLSRLANHDLPLHYLQIDAVAVLALMIFKHPTPGRRVKYYRVRLGRSRNYMLIAQHTVSVCDDFGRITQVLSLTTKFNWAVN